MKYTVDVLTSQENQDFVRISWSAWFFQVAKMTPWPVWHQTHRQKRAGYQPWNWHKSSDKSLCERQKVRVLSIHIIHEYFYIKLYTVYTYYGTYIHRHGYIRYMICIYIYIHTHDAWLSYGWTHIFREKPPVDRTPTVSPGSCVRLAQWLAPCAPWESSLSCGMLEWRRTLAVWRYLISDISVLHGVPESLMHVLCLPCLRYADDTGLSLDC